MDSSEVESVSNSSSEKVENITEICVKGGKKYINPLVFQKLKPIVQKSVPSDIDGVCVYQVPIRSNLANCKGGRPLGNTVTSNTQQFKGMH